MDAFVGFKTNLKQINSANGWTKEESDHFIAYANGAVRMEYVHYPELIDRFQDSTNQPMMIIQNKRLFNEKEKDEKWLFYLRENEHVIQVSVEIRRNGDLQNPTVSLWETEEIEERLMIKGRSREKDSLQNVIQQFCTFLMELPANRLHYVTGSFTRKDELTWN